MQPVILSCGKFNRPNLLKLALVASVLSVALPFGTLAQQHGQQTFGSAEEASQALVKAAQNNDEQAMLKILGPEGKQIVSSGDDAEDAANRVNFVQRFQEMHRLVREPDDTTTLYIGAENWPTPIPLVAKGNSWYFDTEAGKREILYRRIGRNELSAGRVSQELEAAEKEYRSAHQEYPHRVICDQGQRDGLYWKSGEGEPRSPIGPMLAAAIVSDTEKPDVTPAPYRGYYFHPVAHQSASGKTEGFDFIAFPAEYRSSGVMTFFVGEDGVVYQKDLGKKTPTIKKSIRAFVADSSWQRVEDLPEETADERSSEQQKDKN
jgi:hypothetical protein